jgi:hypothetical protein
MKAQPIRNYETQQRQYYGKVIVMTTYIKNTERHQINDFKDD